MSLFLFEIQGPTNAETTPVDNKSLINMHIDVNWRNNSLETTNICDNT